MRQIIGLAEQMLFSHLTHLKLQPVKQSCCPDSKCPRTLPTKLTQLFHWLKLTGEGKKVELTNGSDTDPEQSQATVSSES